MKGCKEEREMHNQIFTLTEEKMYFEWEVCFFSFLFLDQAPGKTVVMVSSVKCVYLLFFSFSFSMV